ncbi:MAG TPA: cysteine--tRNA ligase, partial [Candidatus Babeliales bacterium]|nr:cysteine--tRNA ligase [Candidatus Babeliales bacterium]
MLQLTLTNTLSGQPEPFQSLQTKQVRLYVCGITPYDFAHIGHGRCYVTFDLLLRLLRYLGYQVTYCRNFTDIDDKTLKRAATELGDPKRYAEISQKFIQAYHLDMQQLNCLAPDFEPLVTGTIPEIIDFIARLVAKQHAYVVDGDVYFAVDQFPAYGQLSKRNLAELQVGARVEVDPRKRNPLDFALWKAEPTGEFWSSPWGWGRPGWHIECSAMAAKHLGTQIDIHGGGMDLIFPHHENEIAQSEALHNQQFAKFWLHNAFVQINQEKMSKSLGNFFTLQDVFQQFDPMVVRYHFIKHHYRAPLDFAFDELEVDRKTYQKLGKMFTQMTQEFLQQDPSLATLATQLITPALVAQSPIAQKMVACLCQDLNTSALFGVLYENLPQLKQDPVQFLIVRAILQQLLGLT